MTENQTTPRMALILGWGGIIPFVAAALGWLFGDPVQRFQALNLGTIYGGVIITFLGAVHWGLAICQDQKTQQSWHFFWSVLPALAVVPALFVAPMIRPLFILLGLLICWGVDVYIGKKGLLPGWYVRMRHGLTAVAAISMLILMRY